MSDEYNIVVQAPPVYNVSVAGLISGSGGGGGAGGDTLTISVFPGVTGNETSYVAGGAGSSGGTLSGKYSFISARSSGIQPQELITAGDPGINQIKVVGNTVSWSADQPLGIGEKIIIVAKTI